MILEYLHPIMIAGEISTDDIIPAHWKHKTTDPDVLAQHIFENSMPDLRDRIQSPCVLVSDSVFGVGSSREQAVSSMLAGGIRAVIAPAFGRIFFRNAWNLGLFAIEASTEKFTGQDPITIDFVEGSIKASGARTFFVPIPVEMLAMQNRGGLLNSLQMQLTSNYGA